MGLVPETNPLAEYLATEQLSYAAFARLVGADRARIQRCAKGKRKPGLDLALAIDEVTKGKVPASCWREASVRLPAPAVKPSRRGGAVRRRAGSSSRQSANR